MHFLYKKFTNKVCKLNIYSDFQEFYIQLLKYYSSKFLIEITKAQSHYILPLFTQIL